METEFQNLSLCRKKKRSKSRRVSVRSSANQMSVRGFDNDVVNEGIYDTIDDLSRQNSSFSKDRNVSQGYTDAYSAPQLYSTTTKHNSKYNIFGTSDDDYNRINLQRTNEIVHSVDYSRLSSGTDSGVGDSIGLIQKLQQENRNNNEDKYIISNENDLKVSNSTEDSDSLSKDKKGCDTITTDRHDSTSIATETDIVTKEVKCEEDYLESGKTERIHRKDSYEIPNILNEDNSTYNKDTPSLGNQQTDISNINH